MSFDEVIEDVGKVIDAIGVAVMCIGVVWSLVRHGASLVRPVTHRDAYLAERRRIGRSILLGLEILVAGDIIRTVATTPTFASVGVLALIVLIRTFLSFTLEMEVSGRWPWQQAPRVVDEA